MKTGIELIAEERQRVIEKEGYTTDSDSRYTENELIRAAICYLLRDDDGAMTEDPTNIISSGYWPFPLEFWKPSPENRIRELEKAGQFIAAEIDRLLGEDVV